MRCGARAQLSRAFQGFFAPLFDFFSLCSNSLDARAWAKKALFKKKTKIENFIFQKTRCCTVLQFCSADAFLGRRLGGFEIRTGVVVHFRGGIWACACDTKTLIRQVMPQKPSHRAV
jgi:hypothetical protein